MLAVKLLLKESNDFRKSITAPMDEQKNDIMEHTRVTLTNDLDAAQQDIEKKIRIYRAEKQRQAQEAARKAEEEQRKRQDRLDARADKAESEGKHEKAASLRDQADNAIAPTQIQSAPKSKAVRNGENWQFEVTNESQVPDEYKTLDLKAIGGVVKAMKGKTNIPGIRVFDANSLEALQSA